MTRALVVTPDFPPGIGGIQILLGRLVEHFTRVTADVVTLASPDPAHVDGPRVHRTPALAHRAGVAALNAATIRLGMRLRPDVVLVGHVVGAPGARALQRMLGIPYVQYTHADELTLRPAIARLALKRADAVIAVSDYGRRLATQAGAPEDRVTVVLNGVDLPAAPDRREAARPTIVTVARLAERYKGHDVVLRALPLVRARIPDVQWVVIGDGPLRGHLETLAATHGVADAVRFEGQVSDAQRDAWLDSAAAMVMVSRLRPAGGGEGFGIVYLEAGARFVPVVAGNVAGAVDAVVDGSTGFLVDPEDPVAVADALTRLLEDPALRERMGAAGRARAETLSWPHVAARVEDVLLATAR